MHFHYINNWMKTYLDKKKFLILSVNIYIHLIQFLPCIWQSGIMWKLAHQLDNDLYWEQLKYWWGKKIKHYFHLGLFTRQLSIWHKECFCSLDFQWNRKVCAQHIEKGSLFLLQNRCTCNLYFMYMYSKIFIH